MRRTLKRRYATVVALAIILSVAVITVGDLLLARTIVTDIRRSVSLQYSSRAQSQLLDRGMQVAQSLADTLRDPMARSDDRSIEAIAGTAVTQREIAYLLVFAPDGELIHDGERSHRGTGLRLDDEMTREVLSKRALVTRQSGGSLGIGLPILQGDDLLGGVRVGLSLFELTGELGNLEALLDSASSAHLERRTVFAAGFAALSLLLGLFLAVRIATSFSRPIAELADAVRRFGQGEAGIEIPPRRDDEIGVLAESLGTMARDLHRTTVSKAYVDRILGSMLESLIVTDLTGIVQKANAATLATLGLVEEELIGVPVEQVFAAEGVDLAGMLRELGRRGRISDHEVRYRARDGSSVPMLLSAATLAAEGGDAPGYLLVAQDITTRKRAEEEVRRSHERLEELVRERTEELVAVNRRLAEDIAERQRIEKALRESEQKYRALVERAGDGIALIVQGRVLLANSRLVRMAGGETARVEGMPVADLFDPEACRRLQGVDGEGGPDESVLQAVLVRHDGRHLTVEISAGAVAFEGRPAQLVMIRDITERLRAEEKIRRLSAFPEENPNPVVELDQHGVLVYVNRAGRELAASFATADLRELLPPDVVSVAAECLQDNRAKERIEARRGERILSWSFYPVRGTRSVHAYGSEITELRRMELYLIQAQKLESVGVLAGGIAHDFNNLLTAVLGNASLLELVEVLPEDARAMVKGIMDASRRARDLTQQLLTFSRGGAPIRRLIQLPRLLRDTCSFTLRGSQARFALTVADDLWSLEADEGQLAQVINNLLLNADQAMPDGGTIAVSAENVVRDEHGGPPLPPGSYVRISVADEGIGISEALLPKIFDPYFTTKQKGSGLGLSTVFSITNSHHGHVGVRSKVGVGTTFTIHLPAHPEAAVAMIMEREAALAGGGRVLVMDDEESVRALLRTMLVSLGYEATLSAEGEEAIERYREARAGGHPFDLVILDLTVPGGLGGREALQRIRAEDPMVTALVSSGYSTDRVMAEHSSWGFRGVLAKPYTVHQLSRALREVRCGAAPADRAADRP